ncbi:MAG TPA: hypothetical protein VLD18_03330, partial [Verrucomicrobiae bacterium]|nr:hypothetical protein [Verrucomicrobiae bacterium]
STNNSVSAIIRNADVTSTAGFVALTASDTTTVTADVVSAVLSVGISSGSNAVSLAVGVSVAINDISNTTRAVVEGGSTISSAGGFDAHASSTGSIEALAVSAALSVGVSSGGSVGFSGAGTGVGATNTIANTIEAGVIGGSSVDTGGAAAISATDSASVISDVASAAVSVAAGSSNITVSLTAAVAVAINNIGNDVQAHLLNSTLDAGGTLDLTATSDKNIDSLGLAAAISVSASSGNFTFSGAVGAAIADNFIGGTVEAVIQDADTEILDPLESSVSAVGPITLLADNTSTIDAILATAAGSVSVGSGNVNLALAGAVSVTSNEVTSEVLSGIDNSDVSGGSVSVTSNAGSEINANTVAIALSVAAGSGTVTLSGAFALALAENSIGGSTQALIRNGSIIENTVGNVDVTVTDSASISSNVIAAAVAVSASSGSVSGSLALAVSLADNLIEGASRASIIGSEVTSTAGGVTVTTLVDNAINAVAAAASVSVAASTSVGVSISGAGAWARNVMTNEVEASIVNFSTVDANGAVSVITVDSS